MLASTCLLSAEQAIADESVGRFSEKTLTLKNVRLETGFEYDQDEVIKTKTELFIVEMEEGKVKRVLPNNPAAKAIDAKGLLMLPAFRDMHIHLDKTYYGFKRYDCF